MRYVVDKLPSFGSNLDRVEHWHGDDAASGIAACNMWLPHGSMPPPPMLPQAAGVARCAAMILPGLRNCHWIGSFVVPEPDEEAAILFANCLLPVLLPYWPGSKHLAIGKNDACVPLLR
ncbi:hypothetical protein ACLKA6_010447 [Drosophila palustris]